MGIKYFTEEEIEYLSSNIYVESVNEKQITYTIEFKQFFVREYMNGKGPTLIFESVGLYKRILGAKRIEKATTVELICVYSTKALSAWDNPQ